MNRTPSTVSDIARALCASANAVAAGDAENSSFTVQLASSSRDDEDIVLRLLDQAAVTLYPAFDLRQIIVSATNTVLTVRMDPLLNPPCGPRFAFAGSGWGWTTGAVSEIADELIAQGRKAYFKRHKAAMRTARAVLASLYAANTSRKPRRVLATGVGVRVGASIVAVDNMYAYVGLPLSASESRWSVVGRYPLVAVPAGLLVHCTDSRSPHWLLTKAHCLNFVQGRIKWRAAIPTGEPLTITSHRVSYGLFQEVAQPHTVELEDLGLVMEREPEFTFAEDIAGCVHTAFEDALKDLKREPSVAAGVEAMRCTGEDRYRRAPGSLRALRKERDERCVAKSFEQGSVVPWRESATVEFKARISLDDGSGGTQTNQERVRQIVSALANTHGGTLLIGIGDDGTVLGAPKIRDAIRLTHFAPALVTDSITVHEFPVQTAAASAPMSTDWWKNPGLVPAPAPSARPADDERVVTQIRTTRCVAPFHLCGATAAAAPMVRGMASTLPLSVSCCVERLVAEEYVRAEAKRARETCD